MTLAESLWINGALLTILGALIAVVWSQLGRKLDDLQATLTQLDSKHDGTHERVVQVEERLRATTEKVNEVDARRHRYQVENTHSLQDLQKWITEKVIEALKP